jgi:hypothetical protein
MGPGPQRAAIMGPGARVVAAERCLFGIWRPSMVLHRDGGTAAQLPCQCHQQLPALNAVLPVTAASASRCDGLHSTGAAGLAAVNILQNRKLAE